MPVKRDPKNLEKIHLHKGVNLIDKDVLEIGCGEGRLTELYHQLVRQIVGIDVTLDALQTARNKRLDKTTVAFVDAVQLPFHNGSFDVVIYSWSL